MGAFRISLAGLLGIVLVVGLGMASLRSASMVWTVTASHVAVGYLLGAVLGASYLKGPERGFWAGFALFGWTWLVLVNWSWLGGDLGHDLTRGLGDLAESVHRLEPDVGPAMTPAPGQPLTPAQKATDAERMERQLQNRIKIANFIQIGRLLLCLAFALIGGVVGRAFAAGADAARGSQSGTS